MCADTVKVSVTAAETDRWYSLTAGAIPPTLFGPGIAPTTAAA